MSNNKSLSRFILPALTIAVVIVLAACGTQPGTTDTGGNASSSSSESSVASDSSSSSASAESSAASGASSSPESAASSAVGGVVSFANDVMPILQESCISCHGGERTSRGLNMTTYEKLMAGSTNGAVVVPGDADGSSFVKLVVQGKMPKRGTKLTIEQVQLLKDWVNAGAPNN